jgi:hypothetical protein
MAEGPDKNQLRADRAKVRAVLMREWDPINVRDVPEARGRYNSYIGKVHLMLMDERATCEVIAAHLCHIAMRLGLAENPWLSKRCNQAAAALMALRPQLAEPR